MKTYKKLGVFVVGLLIAIPVSAQAQTININIEILLKLIQALQEQIAVLIQLQNQNNQNNSASSIVFDNLFSGTLISSSFTVRGHGACAFEGVAGVITIKDSDGTVLGTNQVKGVYENPCNFSSTLYFSSPKTSSGYVVFDTENPSGDPSRSRSITTFVHFTPVVEYHSDNFVDYSQTNPSITAQSNPTLIIGYNNKNRESELIANYEVKVKAGGKDLVFARENVWQGTFFRINLIREETGYDANLNTTPSYDFSVVNGGGYDSGSSYILPAGKEATFIIKRTYNPQQAFSGLYHGELRLITMVGGTESQIGGVFKTPSVVLLGEQAPFITSVNNKKIITNQSITGQYLGQTISGTMALEVQRLHPTQISVKIGQMTFIPSLTTDSGNFLYITPKEYGINPGTYPVSLIDNDTGASNVWYVEFVQ